MNYMHVCMHVSMNACNIMQKYITFKFERVIISLAVVLIRYLTTCPMDK